MPYVFNPFTGNFDVVDTNTAAGSDTEVQFNDNGSLNGDTGLTFNKTTNALTVGASTVDGGSAKIYGDIDLDDGGSFSTTVQAVTPTANRTISFPDATGTVALVNGANGTIQYNDAGTNAGDSGLLYDATSGSLTVGGKTVTTDAPVINLSQTWNNAGTTFTGLKLNVTDTASASGSNLLDLQVGGSNVLRVYPTFSNGVTNIGRGAGATVELEGSNLYLTSAGSRGFGFGQNVVAVQDTVGLQFRTDARPTSGSVTTHLIGEAAGTLAQRNGTNAQTYRLYNTYTDASNFERTSITRDSSGLVIDAQKGGTGADPTNLLDVKLGGTSKAVIDANGNVGIGTTSPDQVLDIQAGAGITRLTSTTGTNSAYYVATNTGGNAYFGRDNSSGTAFGTPYAAAVWNEANNALVFGTNNTPRAQIDSSGNFGIATSTPEDKLEIGGAGAGIILASPDGTRYRLTVANGGTLSIAAV